MDISAIPTAPNSPDNASSKQLGEPLLPKPLIAKKEVISREQADHMRKRNIHLIYGHITFMTLYQSICCWNVFDAYLAILAQQSGSGNANTWVGAAESVTGLSTLVFAIPCGMMADCFDRVKMIRFAGILGCIASCTSLLGFLSDNWHVIFCNMALWGLFTSIMGTAAEAVFADSCPAGTRSKQTANKGSLQTIGLAAGPLIMWGVFRFLGDAWTLSTLHVPLIIGCFLGPLAAIPCFFMKDVRHYEISNISSIGVEDPESSQLQDERVESNLKLLRERGLTSATLHEHEPRMPASSLSVAALGRPRGESRAVTDQNMDAMEDDRITNMIYGTEDEIATQIRKEEERYLALTPQERMVPYILTCADLITEIGAGMTVRFFPLFFISDFGVKPTTMSLIFGVYPALVAMSIHICQQLSVFTGRAKISWVFQLCGIFCLLGMVYITNLPILVIVFFARSCFQNASYPVDRSILYDAIPSSKRGRWSSIASLTTMTWSGSAVIGGWISDGHDYRFTFVITAVIYAIGLSVYTPLLWFVKDEKDLIQKGK